MVLLKRICIVKKLLCLASPFIDRKGWESKANEGAVFAVYLTCFHGHVEYLQKSGARLS
jgi:hypothetical protein